MRVSGEDEGCRPHRRRLSRCAVAAAEVAAQRLSLRPADSREQAVRVAAPRLQSVAYGHARRVRRRGRHGVVGLAVVVRKRPHGRAGAVAEEDEHACDVRRGRSGGGVALALAAGDRETEAGSRNRRSSRVPSAERKHRFRRVLLAKGDPHGTTTASKLSAI